MSARGWAPHSLQSGSFVARRRNLFGRVYSPEKSLAMTPNRRPDGVWFLEVHS